MIEAEILKEKFRVVTDTMRKLKRQRLVILIYLAMSALLLVLINHPEWLPKTWRVRFLQGLTLPLIIGGLLSWWLYRRRTSPLEIARRLEEKDPNLNGLALTATELLQKPEPSFLDRRVISQFTDHAATQDWTKQLIGWRGALWGSRSMIATAILLVTCIIFSNRAIWRHDHRAKVAAKPVVETLAVSPEFSATITPGDTELERGSRLVVEAAFAKDVPADATLIISELDGQERDRIPMRLTVDEKVFGGMIAKVDKDARYHVEFGDGKSKQHTITTFVYPKLEQVDVKITPPAYTKLPPKEIKNTMKISAMEGSSIDFSLKVNKPVKEAELFGEDKTSLPLKPSSKDPTILVATMKAEKTQKWRVHLVDDKERANKNPPWISVTVQSNQLAKIEVVFPKRDVQVSQIQELPVEAKVWDDLGVTKSGASFSIAGKTKDVIFKHGVTEPSKKQDVKELLALESENTSPRQLVSYHFWAEDTGPQGEVRRAMSDMFFAEVRHFEDIFREGESPPGPPGKEPKKGDADKLVELEKQIVNATWRLVRDTNAGKTMEAAAPDAAVVQESQAMALEQTKEAMEKAEDAQIKTALTEAWKSMKDALDPLGMAAQDKKRASLNQALTYEQSALEWLHQAQSREHMIMRSKSSKSASGKQKQMQNQLMELEMKQDEQRYEEEKQATEEQTTEQQENLQVLNRLKELARRQEALAEKMKELQKQLDQAKTEQEKEELQNQLKRLEEEQKQLVNDLDDLKERMEKPENAANMAEAKEQLEQTREQVNDAAEKLKEQQLAEAANSATRAQRELEKMQEDFKEKTAKRFGDEMKQMRQQAREVAEKQKQIAESLENQKTGEPSSDTSADLDKMLKGGEASRQIQEQQEKVTKLLDDMKRVSEQAEGNNPLLHRRLYEAVREAKTGGLEEHLDEARMQSRYGQRAEAQDAERKANMLVDQLQQGVEKAAESVLGSETEALRMARTELDKLIKEAGQEGQQGLDGQKPDSKSEADAKAQASSGESKAGGKPSDETEGAGKQPEDKPAEMAGKEPGDKGAPSGQSSEQGQKGDPKGEGKEPGQMAGNQPGQPKGGEQPGQSAGQGKEPGQQQANAPSGQQGQGGQKDQEGQKPGESPGESKGSQPGGGPQMAQREGKEGAGGKKGTGGKPGEAGQGGQGGQPSPEASAEPQQNGAQQLSANRSPQQQPGGQDRNNAGGGGGSGDEGGAFFFDQGAEVANDRPFTGEGYDRWTDRLRNVEELLNQPELRNEAAKVLDNARAMRIDHERNDAVPQVDHLQMRILNPLVELRDRVAEELAKRDTKNPMVPVDRDPVPPAFRELVKRYYQELGNGN